MLPMSSTPPPHPSSRQVDRATCNGMLVGMTKAKIAVTLPPELVARARRAVRKGVAESVSAYVTTALQERPSSTT